MERFFAIVLFTMCVLVLFGYMLEHFGIVILLMLGVWFVVRRLRQHGV